MNEVRLDPFSLDDSPKEQQWQTALQLATALKTWSAATYSVAWHGRWVGGGWGDL